MLKGFVVQVVLQSEEDKRDIDNLDFLIKCWAQWRDLLGLQAKHFKSEADAFGVGKCQAAIYQSPCSGALRTLRLYSPREVGIESMGCSCSA